MILEKLNKLNELFHNYQGQQSYGLYYYVVVKDEYVLWFSGRNQIIKGSAPTEKKMLEMLDDYIDVWFGNRV